MQTKLPSPAPRGRSWAVEGVPGPHVWRHQHACAGSQSLAEHSWKQQMVRTGCWFGKAEAKAKFYSSPSCSFLQLSVWLLASPSLSILPIPLCTCLRAGSTCVGAEGFYSGAGRLHGGPLVCAAHPVPQGSFLGYSGLWAVTPPSSCACSKFIIQLLQIWSASCVTPTGLIGSQAAAWLSWLGAGGLTAESAGCRF